ncbi:MAG: hypothetical protein WA960_00595 [Tunicatimonas sp.]
MISIATDRPFFDAAADIIRRVPRLDELVQVNELDDAADAAEFIIDNRGIVIPLGWDNATLPFLRPSPLPFNADVLLGLVFDALGNAERAQPYLEEHPALSIELAARHCLQENLPVSTFLAQDLERRRTPQNAYRYDHNVALLQQYGLWPTPVTLAEVQQRYRSALAEAPDDEHYGFTLKHYTTLLLDTRQEAEAETLLRQHIPQALSEAAAYALKSALVSVRMAQLSVPYAPDQLNELKDLLWDTLSYYEREPQPAEVGLLLVDASEVANISESYAESLGYINRALDIFRNEGLPELAASSLLRKGVLLYTWAQNGSPQFYKPAIDTYQEALKVFKRDEAPDTFAQIHMHLGVLYAEMATRHHKKSIWAAVSASSFQEALHYYTPAEFPYEHGLACNNYANALTKYPTALRSDNYQKALDYYEQALQVRTADYPYERALTLLNFLEASWHVDNGEAEFHQARYEDMVRKAEEVLTLVEAPDLRAEAERHREQLSQLEETNREGYA